jgi:hypothetical protein
MVPNSAEIRNSFIDTLNNERKAKRVTRPGETKAYMAPTKAKQQRLTEIQDDMNYELSR